MQTYAVLSLPRTMKTIKLEIIKEHWPQDYTKVIFHLLFMTFSVT